MGAAKDAGERTVVLDAKRPDVDLTCLGWFGERLEPILGIALSRGVAVDEPFKWLEPGAQW